jgi:DeoR/GlpR family transcriptional regulator of sugar metabolism
VAVRTLRSFHLDTVFMGIHGMHERAGFTTPNLLEADTNRAFIDASEQLVVLADHTKWGVTGLSTIAELSEADVCVTDARINADAHQVLADRVPRLIVTSP